MNESEAPVDVRRAFTMVGVRPEVLTDRRIRENVRERVSRLVGVLKAAPAPRSRVQAERAIVLLAHESGIPTYSTDEGVAIERTDSVYLPQE